jgi:hypothetical protein
VGFAVALNPRVIFPGAASETVMVVVAVTVLVSNPSKSESSLTHAHVVIGGYLFRHLATQAADVVELGEVPFEEGERVEFELNVGTGTEPDRIWVEFEVTCLGSGG